MTIIDWIIKTARLYDFLVRYIYLFLYIEFCCWYCTCFYHSWIKYTGYTRLTTRKIYVIFMNWICLLLFDYKKSRYTIESRKKGKLKNWRKWKRIIQTMFAFVENNLQISWRHRYIKHDIKESCVQKSFFFGDVCRGNKMLFDCYYIAIDQDESITLFSD